MPTGSLRSAIPPGIRTLWQTVAPPSNRVGDVITFQAPDGRHELVTHRVIAVSSSPQGLTFRTKGDANPVADIWIVHYQDLGWTEVSRVRGFGAVTAFLDTLPGRAVVVLTVFVLALGLLLPSGPEERSGAEVAA